MENILFAFLLTVLAGLSTGLGGLIAFFTKKDNNKFLSICLGFSAGVMIYVSFVEIFQESLHKLTTSFGVKTGTLATVLSFFGGMIIIALIDKLIPEKENPHDIKTLENDSSNKSSDAKNGLYRIGLSTALAITIHNFPEGLASFVSATADLQVALPIVIAIAIHNIPEGVSVAVPIYYASGSRKKAVCYSFLAGLSEPLGAVIGYLILMPFMNDVVYGILFGIIAGIMIFISLDELLPSARKYGKGHLSIYGMVAGMAVMALSLILFM